MSQNSSSSPKRTPFLRRFVHRLNAVSKQRDWRMAIVLPAWLTVSFFAGSFLTALVFLGLQWGGIETSRFGSPAAVAALSAVLVYFFAGAICIGVPYALKRWTTTLEDLGLTRLMIWSDIGLAPLGFLAYAMVTGVLSMLAVAIFPFFAPDQVQDVGFRNLSSQVGYMLAFVTLVGLAPVVEEVLFRGYLYGKLRRFVPVWCAVLVSSLLFGAFHGQFNVGLDAFALGLILCSLREITGSIWAGILLHMIKNSLAFYALFLAPVLGIMGG